MNDKLQKLDNMTSSADKKLMKLLEKFEPQIKKALPKHLSPDRMARIVATAVRTNPKLALSGVESPVSFFGSIIQASQLGLEVNTPSGHAFLIPFRNNRKGITECQLIIGYKGFIELAYRSPMVEKVVARAVFDGDEFQYWHGLDEGIEHRISKERGRRLRPITHAYAWAQIKGKGKPFEVLDRDDIEYRRSKSMDYNMAKKDGRKSIWEAEEEAMARKSAIRALVPYIPQAPELSKAEALEVDSETGKEPIFDHDITEIFSGEIARNVESESTALNEPPDDMELPE